MIYLYQYGDGSPETLGRDVEVLRSDFPRAQELLEDLALHCADDGSKVIAVFHEDGLRGGVEPTEMDDWIADRLSTRDTRSFSPVLREYERHLRANRR